MSSDGDFCINPETSLPWPPNMELVNAQRWALLTGCILSALSAGYVLLSYKHNPVLRRRPGSLLFWRTVCNLGFCLTVIINDIGYAVRGDFPVRIYECG